MARCRAVPRWAGVSPRPSATNWGRRMESGWGGRAAGAASSRVSWSRLRPLSWVAVSLEGVWEERENG